MILINIDYLSINYIDVIENTEENAELIKNFLGSESNTEKRVSIIDKRLLESRLYRNKIK